MILISANCALFFEFLFVLPYPKSTCENCWTAIFQVLILSLSTKITPKVYWLACYTYTIILFIIVFSCARHIVKPCFINEVVISTQLPCFWCPVLAEGALRSPLSVNTSVCQSVFPKISFRSLTVVCQNQLSRNLSTMLITTKQQIKFKFLWRHFVCSRVLLLNKWKKSVVFFYLSLT